MRQREVWERQDRGRALYEAGAVTVVEEELRLGVTGIEGLKAERVTRIVCDVAEYERVLRVTYEPYRSIGHYRRPACECPHGGHGECQHAAAVLVHVTERNHELGDEALAAAEADRAE